MIHRFNSWKPDVADHRDRRFALRLRTALPKFVNRIGMANPIEDQGQLGSCTGNSSTSALEITLGTTTPLSRLMAYYNARQIEGTIKTDAGASIRDVIKGLMKTGVASEATWPYDVTKFAAKPSVPAYSEAGALVAQLTAGYEYVRITTLAGLKTALALGQVVTFGFSVPQSFESDAMAAGTAVLKFPTKSDPIIGGHAVVAVGYDDRLATPVIWVRNSWGKGWGSAGYFRMTQDWFTNSQRLADDLWVIKAKA